MASIDLNGFFMFLAVLGIGIVVVGCFAIYFGFKLRYGGKEVEIVSGRYTTEELAKARREADLAKELEVEDLPLEDDLDDKKTYKKGGRSIQ